MMRNDKATALARSMRTVADDVETLLRDMGDARRGTVHELRSRVGQAMDTARQRYDRLDTGVRSGARQAATVTNDYVHASPWQAIGIGLAVGLAAGWLMMRR
jgi:ElaB/YqjD/DUF883 family membrane-anchored ribosome-binding protein